METPRSESIGSCLIAGIHPVKLVCSTPEVDEKMADVAVGAGNGKHGKHQCDAPGSTSPG